MVKGRLSSKLPVSSPDETLVSGMGISAYGEKLETRIAELLIELDSDADRQAMMRELGDAAWESGVYPPSPEAEKPGRWAVNLISGNPAMIGLIQNKLMFERMPHPSKIENLDEIVSALRPTHDFL